MERERRQAEELARSRWEEQERVRKMREAEVQRQVEEERRRRAALQRRVQNFQAGIQKVRKVFLQISLEKAYMIGLFWKEIALARKAHREAVLADLKRRRVARVARRWRAAVEAKKRRRKQLAALAQCSVSPSLNAAPPGLPPNEDRVPGLVQQIHEKAVEETSGARARLSSLPTTAAAAECARNPSTPSFRSLRSTEYFHSPATRVDGDSALSVEECVRKLGSLAGPGTRTESDPAEEGPAPPADYGAVLEHTPLTGEGAQPDLVDLFEMELQAQLKFEELALDAAAEDPAFDLPVSTGFDLLTGPSSDPGQSPVVGFGDTVGQKRNRSP